MRLRKRRGLRFEAVVLAGIFLLSGLSKLVDRSGTQARWKNFGLPDRLIKVAEMIRRGYRHLSPPGLVAAGEGAIQDVLLESLEDQRNVLSPDGASQ